ncbi:MAG TPA: two-component regulator propeller domain-containing protein [Candidatus Limnocylindria bacterium]|nr:two-component regulator propeller domain-containing protein [Candidatus Limnocylindria bacterium]
MTPRLPWFAALAAGLVCLTAPTGPGVLARESGQLPDGYAIDVWQVEDGLPDNSVNSIVQTSDGYLWFGTFNGLVRFDGLRFQRMDANVAGLESGRVVQLFVDRQNDLWIAMEYGQLARRAGGRFTVFGKENGWPGARARAFCEDAAGRLLVSSSEGALYRFDGQHFAAVLPAESGATYAFNLTSDESHAVFVRRGDRLGTLRADQWVPMPTPGGQEPLRIAAAGARRPGGIWVNTEGDIKLLEGGRFTRDFGTQPWRSNTPVKFMREDLAGNLWVGTWGEGLFRFSAGGEASHFTAANGFPHDTLRCFWEDREGNLWLGTDGGGLIRLKRRIFQSFDTRHGLPAGGLSILGEDARTGRLQGALMEQIFEFHDQHWTELPRAAGADPHAAVFALLFDRSGREWLGTYGAGVFVRDREGWQQRKTADGLVSPDVLSLFEDRDGSMWVGTEAGLSHYGAGQFTNYTVSHGLPSNVIRAFAQDRDGSLWLGTTGGGLGRLKDGKISTFTRKDGLPHDSIRSLLADDDGSLWVGTSGGGLGLLKDGHFSRFSVEQGLPDNEIGVILDDALGSLWLGSNHGVFRVARGELTAVAEGLKDRLEGILYLGGDGLASVQISGGSIAGLRARDGRLWFATSRGVSVVDPKQIRPNPVPPPVVIEEALADGVRLTPVAGPGTETSLSVPAGTTRTELHYAALSLTAPERNRFRIQLVGYDAGWIEVDTRHVAYYTKVTPGTYPFRVLAANSDGVWNEAGATLVLTFRPQWWQTWWFRTAFALVLLGSGFGAYHLRVRRLKLAHLQQEEFSRRLLASQEAERARIAGELHDSLGQNLLVIKSRVALAQQQSAQPGKLAEQLGEAAAMTLDAIREVREISQNLRPFQLDELGLAKALAAMIRKLAAASPIEFRCELADLGEGVAPEFGINLYRIVQECLNNVVKHSQATACSVSLTRSGETVRVVVVDNGRGFAANELRAPGVARDGFGLDGMAERARTLGGRVEFLARPGEGTRVTVTVPWPA